MTAFFASPRRRCLLTIGALLAVAVLVGSFAWPGDLRTMRVPGEVLTMATLRSIWHAQEDARSAVCLDTDGDGRGEYSFFEDLSGMGRSRGVMPASFGNIQQGVVRRSGYCFQLFLPGEHGTWVGESGSGGAGSDGCSVHVDGSEVSWCCYAWPEFPGCSGDRVFYLDQSGEICDSLGKTSRVEP